MIHTMFKNIDIFGFHTEWVILALIIIAVILAVVKHKMKKKYIPDFEAYRAHLEAVKKEKIKKRLESQ